VCETYKGIFNMRTAKVQKWQFKGKVIIIVEHHPRLDMNPSPT
jgi:hypothetical protein